MLPVKRRLEKSNPDRTMKAFGIPQRAFAITMLEHKSVIEAGFIAEPMGRNTTPFAIATAGTRATAGREFAL
jgi:hypothetical protein